jgi:hypothetical protein
VSPTAVFILTRAELLTARAFERDTITAFKGAVAGLRRLYLLQDLSEQCG